MALPIVIVASGGWPITESSNGKGLPVEIASNGFGIAATKVASGGYPVVGSGSSGSPYTMAAGTGSFILTGDNLTPLVDRRLPADVGAFTLTGQAVTLTPSTSDAAETTAFLARTTGLNGTETAAYKTLINGLVADGLFTGVLDALYIFATNTTTTANLNLVSTSYGLTQQGSVTFAADVGYTGNGTTGYFTTGYTPSTAGGAMTLNSTSIGVFIQTNRTTPGNRTPICAADATRITYISPLEGSNVAAWDTNGGTFPQTASTTARGAWIASRTASNSNNLYKNGSSTPIGTNATSPVGLVTQPFVIGAYNNNGSIIFHSTDQLSAAFWGRGLTGAECVTVSNRINSYLNAMSSPVGVY